jgi:predicted RNase H-like HicB family nuclease
MNNIGKLSERNQQQEILLRVINKTRREHKICKLNEIGLQRKSMRAIKIIVEKHNDGYVAYPLGIKGVVVGEGDSYEEALADVKSAILCHIETFGQEVLEEESPVLEAFVAEAEVPI